MIVCSLNQGPWKPVEPQQAEAEFRRWFSNEKVESLLAEIEKGGTVKIHRRPKRHLRYRKEGEDAALHA